MLKKIQQFAKNILVSLLMIYLTIAVLDAFWLGWFAADWYQYYMEGLLREEIITWPWVVFYFMYGFILFVLCVVANRDKPWFYAGIDGALLGMVSYGTYNLTNYSVMKGFPLEIMFIDWSWGIVLTSVCAISGWCGYQKISAKVASID